MCQEKRPMKLSCISILDNFCANKAPQMNQSALCMVVDKIDLV